MSIRLHFRVALRAKWSAITSKPVVTTVCRYEPGINRSYQDLAAHYGTAIVPTRVRKPRDKAKVEVAVQLVQRWCWPVCGSTGSSRWLS